MTSTGFILRLLSQRASIPRWVIGVAVATPVVALVQGCLMLDEFRSRHGNAPRPVMPSRGVVVVRSNHQDNESGDSQQQQQQQQQQHHNMEPLRLLVIGDSLAAGVGVSSSGTPVLPEAIARALSRALNGRAVFWTCVGTPGASSSQIIRELRDLENDTKEGKGKADDDDDDNKDEEKIVLETKFAEWQNATQQQHEQDTGRVIQCHSPNVTEVPLKNRLQWINRIQNRIRDISKSKMDQVAETIKTRRTIVTSDNNGVETTSISEYVSQYDIAIVLTGLNDLKKTYIPFMVKEEDYDDDEDEAALTQPKSQNDTVVSTNLARDNNNDGDANDNYVRILDAMQRRMKPGRPLVVFPAIPTGFAPIFQMAPLNWFLVPLLQKIDHHKKALAQKYPELVLFVEAPSLGTLADWEAERGPLWSGRQTEKVLLKLTDVGHNVREKVEQLMKQHYQAWTKDAEDDDTKKKDDDDDDASIFCNDASSHVELIYSATNNNKTHRKIPGSTLIGPDKVHPNDLGYDIWGRHIAAAIVHSWSKNE